MDWHDPVIRIAALRLVKDGHIIETKNNAPLIEHLLTLSWLKRTSRSKKMCLVESCRIKFETMLTNTWPEWRNQLNELEFNHKVLDEKNLIHLERSNLINQFVWPKNIHYKTAAAITGFHSKTNVNEEHIPEGITFTHDDILRIRLNEDGVIYHPDYGDMFDNNSMKMLGETLLSERAFSDNIEFKGKLPKAIMTIENLGAFIDLPKPNDLLLIHLPGWNLTLAEKFIALFCTQLSWIHFGDLDPKGAAIYEKLRSLRIDSPPLWFIPEWWSEYQEGWKLRSESGSWVSNYAPEWLNKLGESGYWFEQEAILLDPRLRVALNKII